MWESCCRARSYKVEAELAAWKASYIGKMHANHLHSRANRKKSQLASAIMMVTCDRISYPRTTKRPKAPNTDSFWKGQRQLHLSPSNCQMKRLLSLHRSIATSTTERTTNLAQKQCHNNWAVSHLACNESWRWDTKNLVNDQRSRWRMIPHSAPEGKRKQVNLRRMECGK